MEKTYYISTYRNDGNIEEKRFQVFNKKELQTAFDKQVLTLNEDEWADYGYDNAKFLNNNLLTVVKRNGKLQREVSKGERTYYYSYKVTL